MLVRRDRTGPVTSILRVALVHLLYAWIWAFPWVKSSSAAHVPGPMNIVVDWLSRGGPNPRSGDFILRWCSRFVHFHGVKTLCPVLPGERQYPSGEQCPGTLGPAGLLSAFPPFCFLLAFLQRLQVEHMRAVLVSPTCTYMAWFSVIPFLLDGMGSHDIFWSGETHCLWQEGPCSTHSSRDSASGP